MRAEGHDQPPGHGTDPTAAAGPVASVPVPGPNRLAYLPSIYGALLLFLLTLGGVYLLVRLQFLLILLFMSVLVACGIAGPVRRLEQRGLGRAPAILVVYVLIGAVLAGIGWYALPRLLGQAGAVAQDLPEQIVQAQQLRNRLLAMQDDYPILGDLDARLLALAESAGAGATSTLLALPGAVARTVFAVTSISPSPSCC